MDSMLFVEMDDIKVAIIILNTLYYQVHTYAMKIILYFKLKISFEKYSYPNGSYNNTLGALVRQIATTTYIVCRHMPAGIILYVER